MASSGEKYDACPAANALTNEAKISAFHIQKVVACAKAQTFVHLSRAVRALYCTVLHYISRPLEPSEQLGTR
jgi:hypothetical protein